ncbi:MAG: polysaccharide deacetylase family protein [Bryobacteraceae bacterium]
MRRDCLAETQTPCATIRGMLVESAGAAALLGACGMAWAVGGRSSSVFGPNVWRGRRDQPWIALTFDDGPSESTPELLEVLDGLGAAATFFLCGASVRRLPEIARHVVQAGHEIGNHADSHRRLFLRSPDFVASEIRRAQETIISVAGVQPRFFRAPYGGRWFGMRKALRELGLMGVAWTAIGMDWRLPADKIVGRLLRYARNGAIFCLHDGRSGKPRPDIRATIEAVRLLIPELRARGYSLKTVSQTLCPTT